MDPNIYKDPHEWDPSRHDQVRAEGMATPHAFLGWGSGNHPCRKYLEHMVQKSPDHANPIHSSSGYESTNNPLRSY